MTSSRELFEFSATHHILTSNYSYRFGREWSIPIRISFNMQLQSQLFQHNYFVISAPHTHHSINYSESFFEAEATTGLLSKLLLLRAAVRWRFLFHHSSFMTTWTNRKNSHKSIFFTLIAITLRLRDWVYILRDPFHLMHMKWASNLSVYVAICKNERAKKHTTHNKCKKDHHVYQSLELEINLVAKQRRKPRKEFW